MSSMEKIFEVVKSGQAREIGTAVSEALANGLEAKDILDKMTEAMGVVGEGFKTGEIFIPEMLVAAMTMQAGVQVFKPHLAGNATQQPGKFVLGTVY